VVGALGHDVRGCRIVSDGGDGVEPEEFLRGNRRERVLVRRAQ
jgi:hypothetical protein